MFIMKNYRLFILSIAVLGLTACDKHDFLDDLLITGEVGPQAYWELESSAMTAGKSMEFSAQYYTSVPDMSIDRSEVWYSISENISKQVSCPWMTTFSYVFNSTTAEQKRVEQKISSYAHSEDLWNDSLHAYYLQSSFPVSGTLAPFAWKNPSEFNANDSDKIENYFGEGFMQQFKDELYPKMKYADFRSLMVGTGVVADFKAYTDSTFDKNTNSYVRHFPWNADSTDTPVPEKLQELYRDSISFGQLIYSKAESSYSVTYERKYKLRAIMRVYDTRGVYGTTDPKDIDIN